MERGKAYWLSCILPNIFKGYKIIYQWNGAVQWTQKIHKHWLHLHISRICATFVLRAKLSTFVKTMRYSTWLPKFKCNNNVLYDELQLLGQDISKYAFLRQADVFVQLSETQRTVHKWRYLFQRCKFIVKVNNSASYILLYFIYIYIYIFIIIVNLKSVMASSD